MAIAAKEDLYEDYVFFSPRNIMQLIECCIRVDEFLCFDIFYGGRTTIGAGPTSKMHESKWAMCRKTGSRIIMY